MKAEKTSPDTSHRLSQHFLLVRVYDQASANWTTKSDHESTIMSNDNRCLDEVAAKA